MRKKKAKPYCCLGISNALSITKIIDKEVEPVIRQAEKQLKKVAKVKGLHINGMIWIWSVK